MLVVVVVYFFMTQSGNFWVHFNTYSFNSNTLGSTVAAWDSQCVSQYHGNAVCSASISSHNFGNSVPLGGLFLISITTLITALNTIYMQVPVSRYYEGLFFIKVPKVLHFVQTLIGPRQCKSSEVPSVYFILLCKRVGYTEHLQWPISIINRFAKDPLNIIFQLIPDAIKCAYLTQSAPSPYNANDRFYVYRSFDHKGPLKKLNILPPQCYLEVEFSGVLSRVIHQALFQLYQLAEGYTKLSPFWWGFHIWQLRRQFWMM